MIRAIFTTAAIIAAIIMPHNTAGSYDACKLAQRDHYAAEVCSQQSEPWRGLTRNETFNPFDMSWSNQ